MECVAPEGTCDSLSRPPNRRQCGNITCGAWESGNWSKVGSKAISKAIHWRGSVNKLFFMRTLFLRRCITDT